MTKLPDQSAGILNKPVMSMKISTFLQCIVVMLSAAILLSFISLKEEHPYINGTGILLIQMICLVLFLALGNFSTKYPPVIIVAVNLILYVIMRLLILIYYPDSFLEPWNLTYDYLNGMLLYILLGTLACIFGIWIGLRGSPRGNASRKQSTNFTRLLSEAFFFSIIFRLILYYAYGYAGATGSGEGLNFLTRYVIRFFDPIALLIMIVVSYSLYEDELKKHRAVLISVIVAYFAYYSLTGSRGAIYEITMLLLYFGIFMYGNFTVKVKLRYIFFLLLLAPLAIYFYFLIDVIRRIQFSASHISFFDVINAVSQFDLSQFDLKKIITDLSYRLSFFEQLFYPMHATDIGYHNISEIVNFKTAFLSSLNRIIPGHIFGNILFFEYAFPFFWSGGPVYNIAESGRIDYVGYAWTMFGMSYQLFGYGGGIVFIFLFTAVIAFFTKLSKKMSSFEGCCYGVLSLYALDFWIRNFGIDNLIDRCFHLAAILFIYISALKFIGIKSRVQKNNILETGQYGDQIS